METKFRALRIVGTLWKVLAWIALVAGILTAILILVAGVLGTGGVILREFGGDPSLVAGAAGVVTGLVGFVVTLIGALIYFLGLYAMGELVFLLLAIEENTRPLRQVKGRSDRPEASPPATQ